MGITEKPDVRVHIERRSLVGAVNLNGTQKYPGVMELTWLGTPHMPLVLARMERVS